MRILAISMLAFLLAGCWTNVTNARPVKERKIEKWDFEKFMQRDEDETADVIEVQHILIGVKSGLPAATRDEAAARSFAIEIYNRAQKGEDFGELVKEYTDDSPPGIYILHDDNPRPPSGEFSRSKMVKAFGNVGWRLKVGEIGMSDFNDESPYGFHIIKRLK
ncbi:MAG: peptidyl-prolyl cis-trans isomerase [Planctomycetes bacterium]|nr:peptidyl-prolyl cis-trans isomerase [Planctomycetota bacterium]